MSMGADCSGLLSGPLSSASHQPKGSGRGWGGGCCSGLGLARMGGGGLCTVRVWCLSCHSDTSCFCLSPTLPVLHLFINVPNCEASASSGGLWWAGASRGQDGSTAGFGSLRSLTLWELLDGSALPCHTESQERSCTFFIVSQHPGPLLPTSQGKGMCPGYLSRHLPGLVLPPATCRGMTMSGAGGDSVGTTFLPLAEPWCPHRKN